MIDQFPFPALAQALLPHAFDARDAAHDEAHLLRVWRNAARIQAVEGGDPRILMAAALLHDCVHVDKAAPERPLASQMAAERAGQVLASLGWETVDIARVSHAIAAHSFSARIAPETLEAKILQDADRLDAMGFIGVARCMALAGARGAAICHATDPGAEGRALDDLSYALDHFETKLFGLGQGMQTGEGQRLAQQRAERLRLFYDGLLDEVR